MVASARSVSEAYRDAAGNSSILGAPQGTPLNYADAFECPYCSINSQHMWGTVVNLTVFLGSSGQASRSYSGRTLVCASCQNCGEETLLVEGGIVLPIYSPAPPPTEDMPAEVLEDFKEARAIVEKSPRGAAALLRLVIQKLCPILGATKPDINAAIGELVAAGKVSPALQQALDTVRVIGNEAVHPGTLDLSDDRQTATSMFSLINFIVEKAITEPKHIGQLYQALPAGKLAGIAQRDKV